MAGDYSRLPFDRLKHYSRVRMQQGRVQLDSDWNEQAEIFDRRIRAVIIDLLGRCAVSRTTPGAFAITRSDDGFSIGAGRMYVDGLLAENFGTGSAALGPVLVQPTATLSVPYDAQPYLPTPPPVPDAGTPYLVYLDLWEREVTAVEDPALLDPALGGADTSTRMQTVWQVKILADVPKDLDCARVHQLEAWTRLTQPSAARLTAEAPGRYRGTQNQLYRVEIHEVGQDGPTFKWSRDNASVAARVSRVGEDGTRLRLEAPRDIALRIEIGDHIEVTDDVRELSGSPGDFRVVAEMDRENGIIGVSNPLPAHGGKEAEPVERGRRWDAPLSLADRDRWIELDHGIRIRFGGLDGDFRTGDHWLIPARSDDRSIEPIDEAPPRGVHHQYCPLAMVTAEGTVEDCRPTR